MTAYVSTLSEMVGLRGRAARGLDVDAVRSHFPALKTKIRNVPLAYLDNASTSQKPQAVLDKMSEYYREYAANVHRAIYSTGERATEEYEAARRKVADFIGAPSPHTIIFTRGTTEAINLVANAWGRSRLSSGDEILLTEMEHHSNLVPWQMIARATGATLRFIPFDEAGVLDLRDPDRYFSPRTKLVAVTAQSNVIGTVNPVAEIIGMAKAIGAVTVIDAAQAVPHAPVDVGALGCDFLAFSGHKMAGPTGVGVLFGREQLLQEMDPFLGGGEMIRTVTLEGATWNDVPWKFEAGTPNIAEAIGLGAAVDYLSSIGLDAIRSHETHLTSRALDALREIPEVTLYGDPPERGPVVSFNVDAIHPHDLAQILDYEGIAVRAGHHCAQPTMARLNVSATARASFYLYNTTEEIDRLAAAIRKAVAYLGK